MNIDLNKDNMKEIFTQVVDVISELDNRDILYEGTTLPIVPERKDAMLYFKIKDASIMSYAIGLTLEDGTVTKTDPDLEIYID
jgi:hypothetical protein